MDLSAGRHLQDGRLDLDEAFAHEPSAQGCLDARARLQEGHAAGDLVGAPVGHAGPSHAARTPCRVAAMTMTPRQIDTYCGKLPAAKRSVQWEGVIVFKVSGKMFAMIVPDDDGKPSDLWVKSAPEHFDALSRSKRFRPAPYLARAKCVAP